MKKYRKLSSLKFLYEISNDGELRNVKSKKAIKGSICKGYIRVGFRINGEKYFKRMIHQLVMEAWGMPYPDPLCTKRHDPDCPYCIDHIDRNKLNNHISNLRWVTKLESTLNRDYSRIRESSRESLKHATAVRNARCRCFKMQLISPTENIVFENGNEAALFLIAKFPEKNPRTVRSNLWSRSFAYGYKVIRIPIDYLREAE